MPHTKKLTGILATTLRDRHGEPLPKEHLEALVSEITESSRPQWVSWNHETTLPPIGIMTSAQLEPRSDGEFQVSFDSELLDADSFLHLPKAGIEGLQTAEEDLRAMVPDPPADTEGSLTILYDPRNFEHEDIVDATSSLIELVPTDNAEYIRKAELPHPVIWMLIGWAGGQIASGFLSRFGEKAADALVADRHMAKAAKAVASLFHRPRGGSQPDVIFGFPRESSGEVVEAAVENADEATLRSAWREVPLVFALAKSLISRNRPGFFADLKFIFNPRSAGWEVNYLTIAKSRRIVLGPRYYVPDHPLRKRWLDSYDEARHPPQPPTPPPS